MPWLHRSFWIGPLLIAGTLTLFSLLVARTKLYDIYRHQFGETRRERLFLASFGFFTAVVVVRGITIAIHNDFGPFHNVVMSGRHIHHMVWGILLLFLVGHLWLLQIGTGSDSSTRLPGRLTSLLYGVAAALILDEFALWLNLSDVYWQRQGRESYEAMALFGEYWPSESSASRFLQPSSGNLRGRFVTPAPAKFQIDVTTLSDANSQTLPCTIPSEVK